MKRNGKILALTAALCLLAVLLCGCGSRSEAVIKALREGDAEQANELYFNKVQANEKAETEFSQAYTAELQKVYDELNSGSITYDEANALVQSFEAFKNSGDFRELTERITRLAASKALYQYAEDYMASGEYLSAVSCYDGILADDTNYAAAQQRRGEAYGLFVDAELERTNAYAASGDYMRAIGALMDDAELYPDEARFADALRSAKCGYVNAALDDAAARFTSGGDYTGAMAVLEAADGMGDETLEALLERGYEYYQSFEPVSLVELNSIYYDEELRQNKDKVTDNYGQTYTGHFYFTNKGFWVKDEYTGSAAFRVTDYDKLSCRLILIQSDKNAESGGELNLYLDGSAAYKSPTVQRGTEPIDIELDLSGAAELRVEMVYHTHLSIQLVDAYVLKDTALAEPFSERA
jgi:tetratricopeptide (TPR) repeat protein